MRTRFKVAIIESGFGHQEVARRANKHLAQGERLTEYNITQFVTERKSPLPEQAAALACVLGRTVADIFPSNGDAS